MHRPPGEVWNSWQFTGAAKATIACWLWPFKSAVTTAFWLALTLPETALNVALLCPAGTVTLGGTASNALLLAIVTTESVVAAASKVTEHVPDLLLDIAEGEQCSDLGCRVFEGAWSVSVNV